MLPWGPGPFLLSETSLPAWPFPGSWAGVLALARALAHVTSPRSPCPPL